MPRWPTLASLAGFALLAWAIAWPWPAAALAAVELAAPWAVLLAIAASDGRMVLYPKRPGVSVVDAPTIEPAWQGVLGRIWLGPRRRIAFSAGPAVFGLGLVPVIALVCSAVFGGRSLTLYPLAPWAAGLGVALIAAGWIVDKSTHASVRSAFLLLVLGLAYGAAGAAVLDQAFDHAQSQVFQTTVTRKYITRGTKGTYPHLLLAPWGPVTQAANEIDVGRGFYDSVSEGGAICVVLHPGLLKAPWYGAAHCVGGVVEPEAQTLAPAL